MSPAPLYFVQIHWGGGCGGVQSSHIKGTVYTKL